MPPLRFSHLLFALLLSLSLSLFYSKSSPTRSSSRQYQNQNRQIQDPQDPLTCAYKGNPDLYGFGIRLGLYLQWTASVISKAWTPSYDSLRDLLDADAIFLLAIFVATAVYSAGVLEPAHDVDILILLHMFFADVYCVMVEIASKDNKITPVSAWGSRYRALVVTGMSAYAVWFWFRGLDTLPTSPCGSVAFLFAKVVLKGKVRFFFQVMAAINLAFWSVFGFLALIAFPFDPYSEYIAAKSFEKTRWWRFNRDHGYWDPRRVLGYSMRSLTAAHSTKTSQLYRTQEFWRFFKQDHPFIWRMLTATNSADGYHKQYRGKTRHEIRINHM